MEPKQRYTFGKDERLKSRKTIEQLFAKAKSFSVFPFRVLYLEAPASSPANLQVGFSASSRHFKKAVDRNRIKRLMREAYRLQKNELNDQLKMKQKHLAVFFIYVGNELPEHDLIFEKTGAALNRIKKIVHENSAANT